MKTDYRWEPCISHKGQEVSEFVKDFALKDYKVDQIELWVEGVVESGSVTKLVLSVQGSGGMRIILKPND